jgi:hypothetical protein
VAIISMAVGSLFVCLSEGFLVVTKKQKELLMN